MRYLQLLSSLLIAVSVAQQVNAPSPETPLVPTVNAVLPGRATEWKTAEATAVTTLPTTASARVPTQLPGLPAKSSQVLTDDDFEHLTQAATGSTTGPWFVMFYAPWCGHCRMMSAEWEKLASMAEEFSVARVDATANIDLARRFEIRGFPTVLFFNKGKLYKYSGRRTAEAMMSFATNGYMSVEGVLVPRPKTFMDKALTMSRHAAYYNSSRGWFAGGCQLLCVHRMPVLPPQEDREEGLIMPADNVLQDENAIQKGEGDTGNVWVASVGALFSSVFKKSYVSYLFWTALLNIINGVALIMAYTLFAPTKTLNTVACGLNTVATTIASLWLIAGVVMFLAAWGYTTIDFQGGNDYFANLNKRQKLVGTLVRFGPLYVRLVHLISFCFIDVLVIGAMLLPECNAKTMQLIFCIVLGIWFLLPLLGVFFKSTLPVYPAVFEPRRTATDYYDELMRLVKQLGP
ncbi:MAG: hypothetical protein KVP17_002647 [Porospora cf. gigantea B]|uniref:uncharacterized protein n=1 Tax=Porospora cf. gigantea B TaxID=2853592 RepID=UPI0035719E1F|nr:MAG: hypothetical protein KVP17_002647 [Porospora cf. gigantea B]